MLRAWKTKRLAISYCRNCVSVWHSSLWRSRILIRALYFEELTEREYAKQINISQKAVNKRRHKILSKLRTLMKIK